MRNTKYSFGNNFTYKFKYKTKQFIPISCSYIKKIMRNTGGIYWFNVDGTCIFTENRKVKN